MGLWTIESDDGIDWTVLDQQVRIAVECTERNANLIANAPYMLQALQELIAEREEYNDTGGILMAKDAVKCAIAGRP